MILSVYVTDYWVSGALLDIDPEVASVKIIDSSNFKIPYNPSLSQSVLTNKKLSKLLSSNLVKLPKNMEEVERLIISSSSRLYDIPVNIEYRNVENSFPFAHITLDHYSDNAFEKLDELDVNTYMNCRYYRIDVPADMRNRLDILQLKSHVKSNVGTFLDIEDVVISTHAVSVRDTKKYIDDLIKTFSGSVKIAGIWKFSLDDKFLVIPLVGGLIAKNVDVRGYFERNPLSADGKLIVAPGVTEIEVSENEGGDYKVQELKPNDVNVILLPEDSNLHVRWKSPKSKFQGEVFGSKLGLFIDTREIDVKR